MEVLGIPDSQFSLCGGAAAASLSHFCVAPGRSSPPPPSRLVSLTMPAATPFDAAAPWCRAFEALVPSGERKMFASYADCGTLRTFLKDARDNSNDATCKRVIGKLSNPTKAQCLKWVHDCGLHRALVQQWRKSRGGTAAAAAAADVVRVDDVPPVAAATATAAAPARVRAFSLDSDEEHSNVDDDDVPHHVVEENARLREELYASQRREREMMDRLERLERLMMNNAAHQPAASAVDA